MALQLYYDKYKGFVKSENGASGQSIIEHDQKGWKAPLHEQTLEIPSRNVKIVVRTNLGWGEKSYMNAWITMTDKSDFNFFDTSLVHPINLVCVKPGDWNKLFDSIINLYNNIYNSENSINAYFDVIEESINSANTVNKMVDALSRLAEISDGISGSIYCDNVVVDKRMKKACRLITKHIMETYHNVELIAVSYQAIEAKLQSVFKFLFERKEIWEMLTGRSPSPTA